MRPEGDAPPAGRGLTRMARWWPTAWSAASRSATSAAIAGSRSASLQTRIAIGGIGLGVTALIVVLGVMNGLRDDLRDRILVASPAPARSSPTAPACAWMTGAAS